MKHKTSQECETALTSQFRVEVIVRVSVKSFKVFRFRVVEVVGFVGGSCGLGWFVSEGSGS